MPRGKTTHDTGGTQASTNACLGAIRKIVADRGACTETEARGIAMSLYPPQVLVRIGAQKLKNRARGTTCRFAAEVDTYMSGGSVSPDAVQWFKVNGGNRQLTRLKERAASGTAEGITWDPQRKEFLPA